MFAGMTHFWRLQVALATQVYDYVDQRIRRLDKDMKAFDGEIARERAKLGLPVSVTPSACLLASFLFSHADVFFLCGSGVNCHIVVCFVQGVDLHDRQCWRVQQQA